MSASERGTQSKDILAIFRAASNLVHATQRERGGSSVYLASSGTRFASKVAALREETDLAIVAFLATCDAPESQPFLSSSEYASSGRMLVRLAPTRTAIDRLTIDAGTAIEYLTDLNEAMLLFCGTLIEHVEDVSERARLLGLLALVRAKELTGAERAILAQVFTEDRFRDGYYLWAVALISAQETLMRVAVGGNDDAFAAELARINEAVASTRVTELETAAFVNGVVGLDTDPAEWFGHITGRIDRLHDLETSLFGTLNDLKVAPESGDDLGPEGHIVSEAISATVLAMSQLRSQVDDVRNGSLALRDFLRGHGEALVGAEQELRTALQTGELTTRANRDELTGVLNRSTVPSLIEAAGRRSIDDTTMVAVLMIDLDNFKVINDSLGHVVGDQLLCSVAERLRRSVRADDAVARVGGDEFIVVAGELESSRAAEELAEYIISYFKEPHKIEGRELVVDVTIGIGISRDAGSVDRLLRDADLALHRGKSVQRGGIVIFDQELRVEMKRRHDIEVGVREALADNKIRAVFQPIVDLATNKVAAVEALARWDRGDEVVSAGKFCGIATDAGLLPRIDEVVIRSAFTNRPVVDGYSPKVTVNVSDLQLRQPFFAERFREDMIACGISPEDVWVEVTEHQALTTDVAAANLERLREQGCTIALDDFGSGFSALSVLRQLPLDVVKLDGLFVQDIDRDRATYETVRSVLAILEALNLRSVAEGVETSSQLETLLSLGCNMAQGFYLAEPSADASSWSLPQIAPVITDLAA